MYRKDPFVTGEYYHIYNRGIDKRIIFKSKKDYERFIMLLYLANSMESFRLDDILNKQKKVFEEVLVLEKMESLVSIGAWCLMPNHFHILVRQEIDGGITKFMKKLGVAYSMYFNIKYERTGALFGGLFKSRLIKSDDNYLKHLFAYIHLNPLDLKFSEWKEKIHTSSTDMKKFLEEYSYSSYLDFVSGDRKERGIIAVDNFPEYFENTESFMQFVENYFVEDK